MDDYAELLERVEQGLTTVADADLIRDLLDKVAQLEQHFAECQEAIDG
jgi:hypothetical protein